jgi:hypothetical protein
VLLTLRDRLDTNFKAVLLTGDTAPECQGLAERHGIMVMHKPIAAEDLKDLIAAPFGKAMAAPVIAS